MPASAARQRLLDTAVELFSTHGIHSVGVDTVVERSGVAKMTLYKHFASKEALAEAALRQNHERWRAWFVAEVEKLAATPDGRLLAVFDVLAEWARRPEYRGCMFLNTLAELRNSSSPARGAACDHLQWLRSHLASYARDAEVIDPESVASELTVLVAGAITAAQACHSAQPAMAARRAAERILNS